MYKLILVLIGFNSGFMDVESDSSVVDDEDDTVTLSLVTTGSFVVETGEGVEDVT